ncbi:MFS transporter [Nonomuraea sp. NPDC050680]|uniref:MFS transporter n=1 Tax=Nonomuraea sp. NPDC050680 TaxID=3154630 RepID=UPI0033DA2A63
MTTPTSPATAVPVARRWAILAVILAADILDLLDSTITSIAAPSITRALHGGDSLVQWLGTSYALALGVLLVVGGRLGDKFGRRRLFLIGLTGFTIASIACGLAFDPVSIIVARLVQGAFGALLIPQGFGILGSVFPREEIGKAFSAFGPTLGLSAVGGPILAGFLIDADLFGLGWRAMFLINIVLGGTAIAASVKLLPHDEGDPDVSVDGLGSGLLGVAMFGLLFGLINCSANGWTLGPVLSLAAGLLFAGLFARRQVTAANPLIQPSLLKNRGFTSGLILGVVFFAAVAGLLYVLSLFLQNGLSNTPLRAALVGMAPVAAGIVISSIACFTLIAKLGRTLIFIGLLITLTGTGWLYALVHTSGDSIGAWELVPAVFVIGLGMGTCFGTIYDVTMGDTDPEEAGSGSGSLSAVQQLANAIGAAAVTTVYFKSLGGGQAHAVTTSLIVVAGVTLLSCCVVWLLPRHAPTQHH